MAQYISEAEVKLNYLSSDELRELLNDDEKLEARVNDLLAPLEDDKAQILNSNVQAAEESLAKEPELIELRSKVNELSEKSKELCADIQEKLSQMKSKSSGMNQDTALALLQTAAAESEEASERIVKQFLDKELQIDGFLEQFMVSRKTMHLRKLKAEKMNELIRRGSTNSYNNFNRSFYPYQPAVSGGNLPYPIGLLDLFVILFISLITLLCSRQQLHRLVFCCLLCIYELFVWKLITQIKTTVYRLWPGKPTSIFLLVHGHPHQTTKRVINQIV
ncbi:Vacuolar protein sorting-associated protein 37B, partial [Pseudolycoriella hygida]